MIQKRDYYNIRMEKTRFLNTYSRRPLILKYYQRFDFIKHAIEFEKQVKGWNRKKKEALFLEDWNEIKRLSNLKKK